MRKRISPPIVALFIQLVSLGLLFVLYTATKFELKAVEIVLLQAAMTLLLTRWFNLAWWWYIIQPLFPAAIALMLTVSVPSSIYFLIFSFLLVFYWTTFRTQVPYYPSTKKVWTTVEKLLPEKRPISFVDVGSGLGGLILYLSKKYPGSRFLGVEIAPLLWLLSYLRTLGLCNNAQFVRSNYEKINFAQFDVVFVYLSPAAMSALWAKAKQEMLPGSTLISFEFPIVGVGADCCICPKTGQESSGNGGVSLYLWHM